MAKKTNNKITEIEVVNTAIDVESDEIIVKDPEILRPRELPLVIELPANASKAQIEYAKVLNGYAYKNPAKWAVKKAKLIAELKALKNAPDPVELEGGKISYGNKLIKR